MSVSNGLCQTRLTNKDSVKVPIKFVDNCIRYKIDAEYYMHVADSVALDSYECKKQMEILTQDKWKSVLFGYVAGICTVILTLIVLR